MKFSPERLREARGNRSIEELAFAAGVSAQSIRNWEAGKHEPAASTLAALAKYLGRPMEFFISQDSGEAA